MLPQLANKHKGISRVVKRMKNNEIPSNPIGKLIFKIGIHKNFSTYWKVPIELLKKTHKNKESTNVKQEQLKAMDLNNDLWDDGINNKVNAPNKGSIKI